MLKMYQVRMQLNQCERGEFNSLKVCLNSFGKVVDVFWEEFNTSGTLVATYASPKSSESLIQQRKKLTDIGIQYVNIRFNNLCNSAWSEQ